MRNYPSPPSFGIWIALVLASAYVFALATCEEIRRRHKQPVVDTAADLVEWPEDEAETL